MRQAMIMQGIDFEQLANDENKIEQLEVMAEMGIDTEDYKNNLYQLAMIQECYADSAEY